VSRLEKSLVLVAATMMWDSGRSLAAQEAASDITVAQDLTAVIALQGQPCGQVVSAAQQGADGYLATCQDGNRYRIFVNELGRVVVEKHDSSVQPPSRGREPPR
jgi:hypothetical protein